MKLRFLSLGAAVLLVVGVSVGNGAAAQETTSTTVASSTSSAPTSISSTSTSSVSTTSIGSSSTNLTSTSTVTTTTAVPTGSTSLSTSSSTSTQVATTSLPGSRTSDLNPTAASAAAIPTGCSVVPLNGTLGADGWITATGGGPAAKLDGICSVARIDIAVENVVGGPANGAYDTMGVLKYVEHKLGYARNFQTSGTDVNISYMAACINEQRNYTVSSQFMAGIPGQPTQFTASIDFAGRTFRLSSNGVNQFQTVAQLPTVASVTPTSPLEILGYGCWIAERWPPAGSRVRITNIVSATPEQQVAALIGTSAGWFRKRGASPELVGDPVNSATGGFDHSMTDLVVPGRGEPLAMSRSYDSRLTDVSPLGVGWWHPYAQSVQVLGNGSLQWRTNSGALVLFPAVVGGSFGTPAGVQATAAAVSGGGWSIVGNDQRRLNFDASGRLVSVVDRSGQGVTVAYDASNRVSVVTEAGGRTLTFTYGTTGAATGRLTRVLGSDNRRVLFTYSGTAGQGRLATVNDVRAKVTTYAYDANGFLVSETDPNGNIQFTNTYDSLGRVVSQLDQLNNLSTFSYNDAAGTTTMTDAAGAVRTWNRVGNVPNGATGPEGSSSTQFNAALDPVGFTDASGRSFAATYDVRGNMLSRSGSGVSESWTYDSFNNPLSYVDGRGNTTTYSYDAAGRKTGEVRPNGVTFGWSWNADGTLATSTDPRGGVSTYTYDAAGNVLSATSPLGNKTSFTYDAAGRVLTMTDPRGNVAGATATNFQTKYTYDAAGNVLTERDQLNRTTTHTYDNGGRRVTTTAPDGGVTTFGYNAANELVSTTAPNLGVTTFEYDSRGNRVKQTAPDGGITTWGYDGANRMTTMVEPRGNVSGGNPAAYTWGYTYDGAGRVLTETDPSGRVTSYGYDGLGRRTQVVRPDGTTSYVLDGAGNVTSMTTEAGTTSSVFDANNRVTSSTDLRGKVTTFEYDLAGNTTAVVDPLGRRSTMAFDTDNRMVSSTDPRGTVAGATAADYTSTHGYDAAGNRTSMTDPLGNQTLYTVDRVGNTTAVRNPRLQTTSYVFDSMNRVTRVTAPVVGATNFAYNTMGWLTSRTDPLLRVSTWNYDVMGRETRRTDPIGRFFTTNYDVAGFRTQVVDAVANLAGNPALGTTNYGFDNLGRITSRTHTDGTPTVSWTYDAQGRVASMVDGTGTWTYTYDAADRLSGVSRGSDTWSYVYDASGNVTSRVLPDGVTRTAVFDDAGQQTSVSDPAGTVSFSYGLAGHLTGMTLPGGVSQTRSIDRAGRVGSIVNTGPAGPIGGFAYTRDANGNPTGVDVSGPAGIVATESTRNTFDAFDRLTRTCFTVSTCTSANQTVWTFDKNSNRLTQKVGTAAQSTYTYNSADELTAIGGPGASSFTYNANGDQVAAGADVFGYNTLRQPTSATVAGVTSTFSYDGNGDRATITTGGVARSEVWDGVDGMSVLVAERNGTGGLLRSYTHVGGVPARYTDHGSNSTGFYLTDTLGSVSNLTTGTGTVAGTYRYDPYGAARASTSVTAPFAGNPLKFTGQQQDPTGLYNLRARHYNPATGRFTQTDPLARSSGAYLNAYEYANLNPIAYIDPTGLRACNSGRGRTGSCSQQVNYLWGEVTGDVPDLVRQEIDPTYVGCVNGRLLCSAVNEFYKLQECPPGVNCQTVLYVPGRLPGVGKPAPGRSPKPVNLPGYKKVAIDMEEVMSGHVFGGSRVSPNKDLFPKGMTENQIERTIRAAYKNARLVRTQVDGIRKLVRGDSNGLTIDMWVNTATNQIETAYPTAGGWRTG
jgi:RHS repeat-associated protein